MYEQLPKAYLVVLPVSFSFSLINCRSEDLAGKHCALGFYYLEILLDFYIYAMYEQLPKAERSPLKKWGGVVFHGRG